MTTQQLTKSNMTKKYLTPDELNARLAETRDQKFRKKSQKWLDGVNKLSAGNKVRAQTKEGKAKIKARFKNTSWYKNVSKANAIRMQDPEKIRKVRENQPTRIKVAVLELGKKEWKYFDAMGDAARYYNWPMLANKSTTYFPTDGSIHTVGKRSKKSWKTRRIID